VEGPKLGGATKDVAVEKSYIAPWGKPNK